MRSTQDIDTLKSAIETKKVCGLDMYRVRGDIGSWWWSIGGALTAYRRKL